MGAKTLQGKAIQSQPTRWPTEGTAFRESLVAAPQGRSLEALMLQYPEPLMKILASDARGWTEAQRCDDYGDLLHRIRLFVVAQPEGRERDESIALCAELLKLSQEDVLEVIHLPAGYLLTRAWLPKAFRMDRLAKSYADDAYTPGFVANKLNDSLSKAASVKIPGTNLYLVPPLHHKKIPNGIAHLVIQLGEAVFDQAHATLKPIFPPMKWAGEKLRQAGPDGRTELRRKIRHFKGSMGFGTKALKDAPDSYTQMALLTAGLADELTTTMDELLEWLELDPSLSDKGRLNTIQQGSRWTLDTVGNMLDGMASVLERSTRPSSFRCFNLSLTTGAGFMIAGVSVSGGLKLIFPTADQIMRGMKPKVWLSWAYPVLASPVFTVKPADSERTGSFAAKSPLIGARRSRIDKEAKIGLPLIGGVAAIHDKVQGTGLEVGYFPSMGAWGVASFRAGANVGFFNLGLSDLNGAIGEVADTVADSIDSVIGTFKKNKKLPERHNRTKENTQMVMERLGDLRTRLEAAGPGLLQEISGDYVRDARKVIGGLSAALELYESWVPTTREEKREKRRMIRHGYRELRSQLQFFGAVEHVVDGWSRLPPTSST